MEETFVVYVIKNLKNDKVYVGSTVNSNRRRRQHLTRLRNNTHGNAHLQNAWNKHGEQSFVYEIIDTCNDRVLLRSKELRHMKRFKALNREFGYNISESTTNFSASGKNHPLYGKDFKALGYKNYWKGKKIPESIRVKMRKPRSEQAKINMSLNHADVTGKNNPMYGKKHSDATRKKISESLTGKRSGDKHPMYGRKRTGEFAGHKKRVAQLTKDGLFIKEFVNITEAAKETGAIRQHISKCCKGERKSTGGYSWRYI